MTGTRRARLAAGISATLVALGALAVGQGPGWMVRDPAAILRRAGWEGPGAAGEQERIRRIVEAFFVGFNTMVQEGAGEEVKRRCEQTGRLLRPFCYEGAAAGYLPRGYFRWGYRMSRVEGDLAEMDGGHRLLHYVGLGVWAGIRHGGDLQGCDRVARGVTERRFRSLVWNGYGFARSALEPPSADASPGPEPCRGASAGAARACAHGYGRGLWFRHRGDERGALGGCGESGDPLWPACAAGLGLASAFVHPASLEIPLRAAQDLDPGAREAYEQGVRAALLVRHQSDPEYLETAIEELDPVWSSEARELLDAALACYRETIERDTFYDDFMACR